VTREEAIATLVGLPESTRLTRAPVTPNDVIVLECEHVLSMDAVKNIKACVEQIWPHNRCVVLDAGMKLKIGTKPTVQ